MKSKRERESKRKCKRER
jgi:hypothetical protein